MGTMRRPPAVPTATPGPVPAAPPPDATGSMRARSRPMADPAAALRPNSGGAGKRAAALKRGRTVLGWAAVAWLGLVYLSLPELRPGLGSLLGIGYLLVLWFFLARTKTLSWQSLAGLFSIGLVWSVMVGLITRNPALGTSQVEVDDLGARTALAAASEPSLIMVPLLLLVVLAPTRIRGFSVTDWLLAGLVAGLSFQAVENLARLDGGHADFGLGPLSGGAAVPDAGFAGRPVLMALFGVTIGLAVAAWRHGGKLLLSPLGRIAWRSLGVLAPLGGWWLTVSVQAGWNATVAVGDRWLTAADPTMAWLLRFGWRLGNQGFGLGWLLLLLFLVALLVDAGRLRNAADEADDPLPYPFPPTSAADHWAGRLTRWAGTRTALPVTAAVWLIATSAAAIAYAVRDLVVVLLSFARVSSRRHRGRRPHWRSGVVEPEPDHAADRDSRWTAVARACAAGVMVRTIRAEAIARAAGPDTSVTRRFTRVVGVAGLVLLLVAGCWLGPHWAAGMGDGVGSGAVSSVGSSPAPIAWLAGALVALGPWWASLAIWQYLVLGMGFIALLILSAGPLDLPAIAGRSVWFAVRAPSGDRPLLRIRSYLFLSSPVESVVEGFGAVLGLVSGGILARPPSGRQVRSAVQQFVASPLTFIPDRRAAARVAAELPTEPIVIHTVGTRGSADLPPVKLADGRQLYALSADDERLFLATLDDLILDSSRACPGDAEDTIRNERGSAVRSGGPEAEYRGRIYGLAERLISLRPEKWSDGQNAAYGMVADTAFYDGRGASWYLPDTLPESIRHKAYLEIDRRLIEFATVVYYPASPFRALEVTTNHPLVAQTLEERMNRLAIPGYVVLAP